MMNGYYSNEDIDNWEGVDDFGCQFDLPDDHFNTTGASSPLPPSVLVNSSSRSRSSLIFDQLHEEDVPFLAPNERMMPVYNLRSPTRRTAPSPLRTPAGSPERRRRLAYTNVQVPLPPPPRPQSHSQPPPPLQPIQIPLAPLPSTSTSTSTSIVENALCVQY